MRPRLNDRSRLKPPIVACDEYRRSIGTSGNTLPRTVPKHRDFTPDGLPAAATPSKQGNEAVGGGGWPGFVAGSDG